MKRLVSRHSHRQYVRMRASAVRYTGSRLGTSKRRIRLYRRSIVILKELEQQGARLAWSEIDGRYRIGGRTGRRNVVIPRSRQQLIRLGCLRSGSGAHPDLFITETGRKLLKKYEQRQVEPAYRQRCSDQRRPDAAAGSAYRDADATHAVDQTKSGRSAPTDASGGR